MQPIIYKMRLDVAKPGNQASIYTKQSDINSRKIMIFLYNGSVPIYWDTRLGVVLRAIKPDGTLIFDDCVKAGNTFEFVIPPQVTAAAGTVECELMVYYNGTLTYSPKFSIYVEEPIYADDRISSTSEFSALMRALFDADEYRYRWANPSASARSGAMPDASVTVNDDGVEFKFTLPRGLEVLGLYPTLEALEADVENPSTGDAYGVGEQAPYELYLWNETEWVDIGPLNGAGGGVPAGGTEGQVIIKQSDDEFDADWDDKEKLFLGREVTGSAEFGLALPNVIQGSTYTRMEIFGRSTQADVPSPSAPQEMSSVEVNEILISDFDRVPPYTYDNVTYYPIPDGTGVWPPPPGTTITLRGVPAVDDMHEGNYRDSTGKSWFCDTYDPVSGLNAQRICYYELTGAEGSENYEYQASPVKRVTFKALPELAGGYDYGRGAAICSHFDKYGGSPSDIDAGRANFVVINYKLMFVPPDGITDLASALAWISNQYSNGTPVAVEYVMNTDKEEWLPIPGPMIDFEWDKYNGNEDREIRTRYIFLLQGTNLRTIGTDISVVYNNLQMADATLWLKMNDVINEAGAAKQDLITASGILKGDGDGGVSSAVSGTDYQGPVTASGLLKGDGAGNISAATSGTDYQAPITAFGILKGDGVGGVSAASAGTDYIAPPAAVTGTGAITVTLADNKEYSYADVTSIAITAANVSCHGFIVFAGSTPSPAPSVSGYSGTLAGDDITEAAASETWEFSCEHGFLVFKNWGVVV